MKKGDKRHGTFTPAFKGNYLLCLQAIAGQKSSGNAWEKAPCLPQDYLWP